ncbi:MAG: HD domain-containing protein [Candidatus Omnitrophica bacterium]|nr:HD domain-containing protein [Candidatus Omnitrophota bacterium]
MINDQSLRLCDAQPMSFLSQYPQLKILQSLARKRSLRIYLVGGFLRDHYLARSVTDFDFAVNKGAILLAKAFADAIAGAFVVLDQEHGCGRVVKKVQGTVWIFDFADFRAASLKKDIASRDFTINTLYADLLKIKDGDNIADFIVDEQGAKKDLKNKIIRMVSPKAFKDDPLRLMRAYSLKSNFGFKIEKTTAKCIKEEFKGLRAVSMERVREEFFKILSAPRSFETVQEMDRIGLLAMFMPQITIMYDVHQGGYHHLDVWNHSLEVLRQFEKVMEEFKSDPQVLGYLQETMGSNHRRFSLIKLAALLHDIGKPETKKVEPTRTSFHGHEHVGKNITRLIGRHLKLSVRERHMVEDLVLYHLRPGYLSNFKVPSEKSVFRFFRDAKDEVVSILALSLADQRATRGPLTTEEDQEHHQKICVGLIKRYFQMKTKVPAVKLLSGDDLIKKLKLKPSPLFAKILQSVQEAQALGKISTKQEALALAAKCIK